MWNDDDEFPELEKPLSVLHEYQHECGPSRMQRLADIVIANGGQNTSFIWIEPVRKRSRQSNTPKRGKNDINLDDPTVPKAGLLPKKDKPIVRTSPSSRTQRMGSSARIQKRGKIQHLEHGVSSTSSQSMSQSSAKNMSPNEDTFTSSQPSESINVSPIVKTIFEEGEKLHELNVGGAKSTPK
jgi:hypothetical protein